MGSGGGAGVELLHAEGVAGEEDEHAEVLLLVVGEVLRTDLLLHDQQRVEEPVEERVLGLVRRRYLRTVTCHRHSERERERETEVLRVVISVPLYPKGRNPVTHSRVCRRRRPWRSGGEPAGWRRPAGRRAPCRRRIYPTWSLGRPRM